MSDDIQKFATSQSAAAIAKKLAKIGEAHGTDSVLSEATKGIPPSSLQEALKTARLPSSVFAKASVVDQLRKIGLGQNSFVETPRPIAGKTEGRIPSHAERQIHSVLDIGTAVRSARKANGLTQQEFADLAGVGRRFLSELEAGKPTLEIGKVLKAAAAGGIKLTFDASGQANE